MLEQLPGTASSLKQHKVLLARGDQMTLMASMYNRRTEMGGGGLKNKVHKHYGKIETGPHLKVAQTAYFSHRKDSCRIFI